MHHHKVIAAVIPAYNEEQAIGPVVSELAALAGSHGSPLFDQILVCDNASTDTTALAARKAGATVVHEPRRGYGSACLAAMKALNTPDIVVFVDGDKSVNTEEVFALLSPLIREHSGLVIGSRVLGKQQRGALTPQQQFGNFLASRLIHFLWQQPMTDLGPFRAIDYQSLQQLDMRDTAFGWTVEMQVKAIQMKLRITEVPVTSLRRIGQSKISGTLMGSLKAGHGIFGMIFALWRQQRRFEKRHLSNRSTSHKKVTAGE